MNPNESNIAETLAREMRKPDLLVSTTNNAHVGAVLHFALPPGYTSQVVDFEKLLPNPRAMVGKATLCDADSFAAFVQRHASDATVVWCGFDPSTAKLVFQAVLDDHAKDAPGWRRLTATYRPELSVEYVRWRDAAGKAMPQVEFAEHLERNQDDIASVESFPTSLDMLKMATEFEAASEMRLKSHTRLQSGGVKLEFVDDQNAETIARMSVFDKFALGLPVFRNADPYRIDARLRYRARDGKVSFNYELMRADKVVEHASRALIEKVKGQLGEVPMLLGEFA